MKQAKTGARPTTWLLTGYARLPEATPANHVSGHLVVACEVDPVSSQILNADFSLVSPIAKRIARDCILHFHLATELNIMIENLETCYHGMTQRSIIVAVRDLRRKWSEVSLRQADP